MLAAAGPGVRAVVVGGGLLGLEAARGLLTHGCDVTAVHRRPPPHGSPGRPHRRRHAQDLHGEDGRPRPAQHRHHRGPRRAQGGRPQLQGRQLHPLRTCSSSAPASAPIPSSAPAPASTVERAIVVDNHMRSVDDINVYVVGECAQHRGMVYGLVAPALGPGQGLRRPRNVPQPGRAVPWLQARHQAEGHGRGARLHGHHPAEGGARRDHPVSRSRRRAPTRS